MPQSLHDQGCSRVSFLNEPGPSLRTPATQLFGKTAMHSGAYESVGLTDFFFMTFPRWLVLLPPANIEGIFFFFVKSQNPEPLGIVFF